MFSSFGNNYMILTNLTVHLSCDLTFGINAKTLLLWPIFEICKQIVGVLFSKLFNIVSAQKCIFF